MALPSSLPAKDIAALPAAVVRETLDDAGRTVARASFVGELPHGPMQVFSATGKPVLDAS